jgi:C1A family cysteine protease
VYNQGQLGSCTANAIAGAIQFEEMKQKIPALMPSRLFIYYNERVIEHTVGTDSGATLRDGLKTVAKRGFCSQAVWPYLIKKFTQQPPPRCYERASRHKVRTYMRLSQDLNTMKGCLASGHPFVFGFTVYAGFESPMVAKTGIVPMPKSNGHVLGGHAVLAVGYNDANRRFIVRNSWGADWGRRGYFVIPYEYLLSPDLSNDFWTVRSVVFSPK